MSDKLTLEEVITEIQDYLNDRSLWNDFKDYIEAKGYSVEELGFEGED